MTCIVPLASGSPALLNCRISPDDSKNSLVVWCFFGEAPASRTCRTERMSPVA